MSGSETSQGFGEYGAFTVSVAADPRLGEIVHELTRRTAEMSGCSDADAAHLADAACTVAKALGDDLDLAYRPMPHALILELRPGRRGDVAASLHAVLAAGDAFARVKQLVPAAELQGSGGDEFCFLTCPRAEAEAS
jgi:hypothetical protein